MAAVTVIWQGIDRGNPNFAREVVSCTVVNNADTYTSTEIAAITAVSISPNYAAAAADAFGVTFAGAVVTFALIAGGANKNYTITIFGT